MTSERRFGVVIGTRPEAIKLSPVVSALRAAGMDVRVCLTEQHSELLEQSLAEFGMPIDRRLGVMTHDQSPAQVCSRVTAGVAEWLRAGPPCRWVIVQGDTATAMGAALAAFYERVPVAHVEAGLRTGDVFRPWPEEMNRRVIAQTATLHFAPTQQARANLIREGIDAGAIEVTGNTVIDALRIVRGKLHTLQGAAGATALLDALGRTGRPIVLATVHRRESLGDDLRSIGSAMATIASRGDCELVFVQHPNPLVGRLAAHLAGRPHAHVIQPLDYISFVALMLEAAFILTDSGGVQEEAAALGKPVLVVRDKTERGEVLEGGNGLLVGVEARSIVANAALLLEDAMLLAGMSRRNPAFGDGHAADRIVGRLTATLTAGDQ